MSEDQRLEQKIDECRKQFEELSAIIEKLQKEHVHETRPEEKLRIGAKLKDLEQQRQTVEQTWQSLEAEKVKLEQQRLVQEARQLERNKAFKEALDAWREIRNLAPDDPQVAAEIQRLEERLQRSQRLTDTFKQLTRRLNEIKPIYQTVITRLRQMGETGVVGEDMVGIVDDFLQGNLSADDFMEAWRVLTTAGARDEPDYRALADRLKRGEIVLFLGSDIPRLPDSGAPIPETMIPALAQQANYQNYSGSLSMLAEYYQMKPEYGRSSLVRQLEAIIATTAPEISLYRLLAKIEQPLVLISVNYDMYLEQQLQQSGRKYALISSVISGTPECEIGSVVVQYSDRETSEFLRLEQELSGLKLIEDGYSLIYKIRGYCSSQSHRTAYQHHILTLAEENYFTFARHLDKLIPNYMVKQFAARGLFFLGYSPHNWEDRLLVNAILDKRRHQQYEPAHVITQESDPFVCAYWNFRGVHRYEIELSEFVRKLEAYLA